MMMMESKNIGSRRRENERCLLERIDLRSCCFLVCCCGMRERSIQMSSLEIVRVRPCGSASSSLSQLHCRFILEDEKTLLVC